MNSAETIIQAANQDGVNMARTPAGTIEVTGSKAAVSKWVPVIRDHKPEILTALQAANEADPDMERRRQAVLRMLEENPEITRATVADGDLDPVRIHLAVRGMGTCELTIGTDKWDPFKFMELLEQQQVES